MAQAGATMIGRRGFITGLVSLVAAPAIVRAGSLMPVRTMIEPYGIGPAITALMAMGLLDKFDMDAARGEIFRIMAVPPQWIRSQ